MTHSAIKPPTRWTPGRWHFSSTHLGKAYDIGAENNSNIGLIYADDNVGEGEGLHNARLVTAAPALERACRSLIAWFDAENTGPDYGSLTRNTHPDGEAIWSAWWNGQQRLCERAETEARAALVMTTQRKATP